MAVTLTGVDDLWSAFGNRAYLLPNIQLIILDESEQIFLEAQSRTADSLIQLEFTGTIGEKFGVVVKLENAEVMEQFII